MSDTVPRQQGVGFELLERRERVRLNLSSSFLELDDEDGLFDENELDQIIPDPGDAIELIGSIDEGIEFVRDDNSFGQGVTVSDQEFVLTDEDLVEPEMVLTNQEFDMTNKDQEITVISTDMVIDLTTHENR